MGIPQTTLVRLACGAGLVTGFVFMSSIIVPDFSQADTIGHDDSDLRSHPPINPHEDLVSLGTILDAKYRVEIYGGEGEPWYSVFDRANDRLLATLLTAQELREAFPDLNVEGMEFGVFGWGEHGPSDSALMIADPSAPHGR